MALRQGNGGYIMEELYQEEAVNLESNSVWVGTSKYAEEDKKRLDEYSRWKREWTNELKKRKADKLRDKVFAINAILSIVGLIYVYFDWTSCYIELGKITKTEAQLGVLYGVLLAGLVFIMKITQWIRIKYRL